MLRFNSKMQPLLKEVVLKTNENKKLRQVSKRGFCEKVGCFFLKELYQPHFDQYTVSQFHDETGFEAFTNSVHLGDYSNDDYLGVGLSFIHQTFQEFETTVFDRRLMASLSLLNDDAVAKFYVDREGQNYLSDDLEGYDTAILEIDRIGLADLNFELT